MSTPTPIPTLELAPGITLSRIVWGAWRLAEATDHSPAAVAARISACFDQGITSFDHADIYGDYRCETLFGDALRAQPGLKAGMQIVTKTDIMLLSKAWPGTRVKHYDTTPAHVRASVERSLQRLGVEAIDLLLIHRPDPLMDAQALGACLDGLVDAGKIRAAGVSNFMPWDVDLLQSAMRQRLVTNQLEIHTLHLAPFTNGQLAHAQQHRMPVMAWSPLAGGRLFGADPAAARVRAVLGRIAQAAEVDLTAAALAWLLHHPARILPVIGTTDLARLAATRQALAVPIDRQTWFEVYEAGLGREVP
jgi:predicted oxidoreductase